MGWQDAPVVESKPAWMSAPEVGSEAPAKAKAEPPSYPAVIGNALNKGLAGAADTVGNLGHNIVNLGKAAYGAGAYALGRKDIGDSVEMMETPNLARKGMEKLNLIRPEAEPQTTGQRIVDSAAQTGAGMALMPASGPAGVARNAATGALSGFDSGVVKESGGSDALATAVGMVTPGSVQAVGRTGREKVAAAMEHKQANAVRDQTLREGQAEGYVVPPSSVNPSMLNNIVESIAGKAAIKQEASVRNQAVSNQLGNRAIGLPDEAALTEARIEAVRDHAAGPYKDVAALSPNASTALEMLKQARHDANTYYKHYARSADPESLKKAQQSSSDANTLEGMIAQEAQAAGRTDLVQSLPEARTKIAKTYDVERALNLGDGNISAPTIGRSLDKSGVKGKTDELSTIGRMAEAFPQVMRESAKVPSAGVSGTNPIVSTILGTMGYGAFGPTGIALAAAPFARGPARSLALSPYYQRHFAQPNYNQGKYMSQIPEATTQEAMMQAALIGAMQERKKKE